MKPKPQEILIVSSDGDAHVLDMFVKIREMGSEPTLLSSNDIPLNTLLEASFEQETGAWTGRLETHGGYRSIAFEDIHSIWWRRPAQYFGIPEELSEQEREFAATELDHALRGLLSALDCYWVNHPDSIRRANLKLEQLHRAAQFGFEVPRTIITNDPAEVRNFYEACSGEVVFKVLTDSFLGTVELATKHPERPPPDQIRETKTTRITARELEQLDSVQLVPCLFQAYVAKKTELRLTVIGDDVFAAEVRAWPQVECKKASVPADLEERCLALVRSYGLNFGALDVIVTPDERYVFLENNPNGQFMWVEKLEPKLRMTEALAGCLIRGSNV
jgi:glutathione synthase/RimK-type ligase-like ATP-grasp enzyme